MKVTIVVDNYVSKRDFLSEHGFSMLLEEGGHKYLFDSGQGMVLLHNLNLIGVKINDIEKIILSHGHDDHTGGLKFFMENHIYPEIIAHSDVIYPKFKIQGEVKKDIGLKFVLDRFDLKFSKEPIKLSEKIIFSGEVPKPNKWELEETAYFREEKGEMVKDSFSDDASLFVKLNEGLLVLTGCAHSGIINIIQYGMSITGETKLFGIIGGMHLKNASAKRVKRTVQYLSNYNPQLITVSHCTGLIAGAALRNALGDKVIFTDVGKKFLFDV